MKKIYTGLTIALIASLGALAWAQQGGQAGGQQQGQTQQKLVRVSTLNSIEANQEFQKNVQILRAQRQQAVQLNAALEKETNAAKKKEIQASLDSLIAKLNDNNKKMTEAYGFSLSRNYTMVVEKAHIYMFVTDEEAEAIKQRQAQGSSVVNSGQ